LIKIANAKNRLNKIAPTLFAMSVAFVVSISLNQFMDKPIIIKTMANGK